MAYDSASDALTLFRLGIDNREQRDGYSVPAGPNEPVWNCVVDELELPRHVEDMVAASRPVFGVQRDSYNDIDVSWFSDSELGYQVTFSPED